MEVYKLPDPEFVFGHEAPCELRCDRRVSNASPSEGGFARQHGSGVVDCFHKSGGWGTEIKESPMRYKAKSIAALQLALGSLPDKMRVAVDPDIEVSAKTVGELHKVTVWRKT